MDAIPLRQMFSILQKFSFPPSSLSLVSNWGGNKNTLAAQVLPKPQVSVTSIIFIVQNSIKGYGGNNDRKGYANAR